ncbi:MAG TPA: prolyl oligopeptidase family serine peptidase [Nannocystaceae bacterium]|nr:prolyl oligopeptidase family serine peptidase [Nannocystaceae bacterium]
MTELPRRVVTSVLFAALASAACDRGTDVVEKSPGKPIKADAGKPETKGPTKERPTPAKPETPTTPTKAEPPPEPIAALEPHPFGVRDMLAMERLSDAAITPDGATALFVRRTTDLAANRGRTDIWKTALAPGSEPVQLTDDPEGDDSPRVTPDGATVLFVSKRSGSPQVWKMPIAGGAATQVTDLPLPVSSLRLSPTGTHFAVAIEVFVDCDDLACTKQRQADAEADKATGQVYDRMFARHWDTWGDGRRNHLFVVPIAGGTPIDVTKGLDADVPSKPFGGPEEYAFAPDGKTIVFTAREAGSSEPWSTDFDLYSVAIDGTGERKNLTDANPAWDTHPRFTPDGKTLVYKAMDRAGYEADRFHLVALDLAGGTTRTIAGEWDRSVDELELTTDGAHALVTADDRGRKPVFKLDLATGAVVELVASGTIAGIVPFSRDVAFFADGLTAPAELHRISTDPSGALVRVTSINDTRVAAARMGKPEQFEFVGAGGDKVYGWVVQPVDFDATKRYPIAFLIHGGPQGSFGDHFHYRWNPQAYAGAGYGVVMIDFHGSTGYGQDFTDAIRNDWGGKPLVDLRKGLAAATKKYAWLDDTRACALGASYGGYMINWIAGQWADGFRCLVNHDGVFDQRAMYYSTEELWFPEWEHQGPQYDVPKNYEKWNPVVHVKKWKTPMLVVQGALDYRVPETQGLSTFTALQRRGVKSRLLAFPDENHWVVKPANSLLWHDTVLAWLGEHTGQPK